MIRPIVRVEAATALAELRTLGSKVAVQTVQKIVRAVGRAVARELKARVPVLSGALKRSIKVRKPQRFRRRPGYEAVMVYPDKDFRKGWWSGFGVARIHRPVKYFHLVELGAKPHTFIIRPVIGGIRREIVVRHPGIRKPVHASQAAAEAVEPMLPNIARDILNKQLMRYKYGKGAR
jgi:hypothetical protein